MKEKPTKETIEMVLEAVKEWDVESLELIEDTIDCTPDNWDKDWKCQRRGGRTIIIRENKGQYSEDPYAYLGNSKWQLK